MTKTTKHFLFLAIAALQFNAFSWSTEYKDPMKPSFTLELIEKLESGENVTFAKYGDGEHNCMIGAVGANIDADSYHPWMGEALKKALLNLSQKHNTYIGKWWNSPSYDYCNQLAAQSGVTIPWAWYHLVLNDDRTFQNNYLYKFVEFVRNTERKVILICNSENARLKDFFKADVHIEIPPRNWSFDYDKWKSIVEEQVETNAVLLFSAGMCSKVLINDLTNQYDITCIDLGSSFDMLARRHHSRAHGHSYQEEVSYYKDFLPDSWDK